MKIYQPIAVPAPSSDPNSNDNLRERNKGQRGVAGWLNL